jgi:hypothetical protein
LEFWAGKNRQFRIETRHKYLVTNNLFGKSCKKRAKIMEKIQIVLDKPVEEEKLIAELRAKFPILGSELVNICVARQKGKSVLEVNTTKIAVDKIRELVVAHQAALTPAKKLQASAVQEMRPQAADGATSPADVVFAQAAGVDPRQDDFQRILQLALDVPGAKEIIEASLAVMSCAQEVVQAESEKILGTVAGLESTVKKINESLTNLTNTVADNHGKLLGNIRNLDTAQNATATRLEEVALQAAGKEKTLAQEIGILKTTMADLTKSIASIQVQVNGASAWIAIIKDAITKDPMQK